MAQDQVLVAEQTRGIFRGGRGGVYFVMRHQSVTGIKAHDVPDTRRRQVDRLEDGDTEARGDAEGKDRTVFALEFVVAQLGQAVAALQDLAGTLGSSLSTGGAEWAARETAAAAGPSETEALLEQLFGEALLLALSAGETAIALAEVQREAGALAVGLAEG
jgi:hypothetical protein